jgi:hypothetical protein
MPIIFGRIQSGSERTQMLGSDRDTMRFWVVAYPFSSAAILAALGAAFLSVSEPVAVICFLLAAGFIALAIAGAVRCRRNAATVAARASLVAVAAARASGGWVNHDEHPVFTVIRGG